MKSNRRSNRQPKPHKLRIEFLDQQAQEVRIAGTFNEWRPEVTPMIHLGNGRWVKELILPPGCHEYRLVVDGQWRCDPSANDQVPNPYGGFNSILIAGGAA